MSSEVAAQPCQPVCDITDASFGDGPAAAPPPDEGGPGAGGWAAAFAVFAAGLALARLGPKTRTQGPRENQDLASPPC